MIRENGAFHNFTMVNSDEVKEVAKMRLMRECRRILKIEPTLLVRLGHLISSESLTCNCLPVASVCVSSLSHTAAFSSPSLECN